MILWNGAMIPHQSSPSAAPSRARSLGRARCLAPPFALLIPKNQAVRGWPSQCPGGQDPAKGRGAQGSPSATLPTPRDAPEEMRDAGEPFRMERLSVVAAESRIPGQHLGMVPWIGTSPEAAERQVCLPALARGGKMT